MKQKFIAIMLFCLVFAGQQVFAQSTLSNLEVQKVQRPSLYFEAEGNADVLEDALVAYFKTKGFKKDKIKGGILAFRGATLEKVPFSLDYYFKVESKGKKTNSCGVWMSTTYRPDLFVDTVDTEKWNAMQSFTMHLRNTVFPYYNLENQLSAKQKDIKNSKDDLGDMEKKKQKLEKDIDDTNKKINTIEGEINELTKQKEVLQRQL